MTVRNPGAKHSIGVGILQRCRITFEGSLGYFGVGLIDGPEIAITGPGRLVGLREHDVRRRPDREERGLAHGRGPPRRRHRRERAGRRPDRDRPEGRHDHRRRRRRLDDRVHDAAGPPDHPRRRRPGSRRLDVRRRDLRRRDGQVARDRLRAGGVDRRRHRADRAQVPHLRARARRPSSRSSSAARSCTTTTTSSRPSASSSSTRRPANRASRRRVLQAERPRPQPDLHARGHQRHPREGGARPVPDARVLDVQADPALGSADVPAGDPHAVRDRGVPGEVRDQDGARRAVREVPDRARHPDLHHRDELRRAVARGEDGARQGRVDGRDRHVLGRGRDDPARTRPVDQVVLPEHPEPVRVQPAPPDDGRRVRVLHRPGLQGRARRAPDGAEGDGAGGRDALAPAGDRPAFAGPAPGLARSRRPLAQGAGGPRGDRLPDPDPAEARRGARVRRRADGRQVRAGHDLPRRRRGFDGRRAAHRDRGDRHPADGRDPRGPAGARGRRAWPTTST